MRNRKLKKYYIGDPCYVIAPEKWDDFLKSLYGETLETGECKRTRNPSFEGKRYWCRRTKQGDGCYQDQNGKNYWVDSAMIAVLPVEMIDLNLRKKSVKKSVMELGNIVNIASPVAKASYRDGRFCIDTKSGRININTN